MSTPTTPQRRSPTARIDLIGAAAALIATIAGYLLGVEPVFHSRSSMQRNVALLEEKSQTVKIAEANLHASMMHRTELAKTVDALPFKLESPDALNERMTRLSHLAEDHRLNVVSSEPSAAQASERFTATPIRITGSCSYAALVEFLRALRKEFPDTRVRELRLSAAAGNPAAEAAFTLVCTWYAAPEGSAAAGEPAPD